MNSIELIEHWRTTFNLPVRKTPSLQDKEGINLSLKLIEEEFNELAEGVRTNNLVEIIDALGDLMFVVVQMANVIGVDVDDVVRLVYESNMSKLCSTKEIATETVKKYFEEGILTRIEPIGDKYKILRISDNKLLKSIEFKAPDFTKLLN